MKSSPPPLPLVHFLSDALDFTPPLSKNSLVALYLQPSPATFSKNAIFEAGGGLSWNESGTRAYPGSRVLRTRRSGPVGVNGVRGYHTAPGPLFSVRSGQENDQSRLPQFDCTQRRDGARIPPNNVPHEYCFLLFFCA
jgi:hypothetical protein